MNRMDYNGLDRCLASALTHLQSARRDLKEYEQWVSDFDYIKSEIATHLDPCINKTERLLVELYDRDLGVTNEVLRQPKGQAR